jgi:hypothetical protein
MPYQPPGLKGPLVIVDLNLNWKRLLVPAAKLSALLDLMAGAVQVSSEYVGGGRELVGVDDAPFITTATLVPGRYTLVPAEHVKEFKTAYEAAAQSTPPSEGTEVLTYDQFLLALKERAAKEASS